MDQPTRAYYEQRFTIRWLEAKGLAFQDLFASVMAEAHPGDFMPCRPWGSIGDRKNDGYLKSERTLFQVYAPNEMRQADTLRKLETDFTDALPYWRHYFDTWVFVHNSREGLPPDVLAKLLELEREHPTVKVLQWGLAELLLRFRRLSVDSLRALYGEAPESSTSSTDGEAKLKRKHAQSLAREGKRSHAIEKMKEALAAAQEKGDEAEEADLEPETTWSSLREKRDPPMATQDLPVQTITRPDSEPFVPSQPSVLRLIWRATGYALTSLCAHFSGYFLQSDPTNRNWEDALLVLALWITSLPFFLDYAIAYHVEDPLGLQDQQAAKWASWNARRLLPFVVVPTAALFVATYVAATQKLPGLAYWLTLVFFASLFIRYGRYTVRLASQGPTIMRHQLVWPVIWSIALPLYSGIIFSDLHHNPTIFLPMFFLLVFFIVTHRLPRRIFVITALTPLVIVLALRLSGLGGKVAFFSTLLFYLSIAAYLAVFEAWAITASLALGEASEPDSASSEADRELPKSTRYYLASLVALAVASLSQPILYIFSDYGRIFFIGITFHAALTSSIWYWAGGRRSRIQHSGWLYLKTAVGFLFLVILVADAYFKAIPRHRFMAGLVNMDAFSIAFALAAIGVGYRVKQIGGSDLAYWWRQLRSDRSGILVLTLVLALLMMAGTLVVGEFQSPDGAALLKADRVFMFYFAAIIITFVLLFLQGGSRTLGLLLGLALSARLFTSLIVGLTVFVPSLHFGAGILEAILRALPFFLASAGGFLLNDACDCDRDRISKPFRPIPRGLLDAPTAWRVGSGLLFAAGITTVTRIGHPLIGWTTQLGAVVGVVAYNFVVARLGWLKGLLTGLLCMLPLLHVIGQYGYPGHFWWLVVGAYCFLTGREIFMDVLDVEGDRSGGVSTLAVRLGSLLTQRVALWWVLVSLVALMVFRSQAQSEWDCLAVDLTLTSMGLLALLWWRARSERLKRHTIRLSWVPILLVWSLLLSPR